MNTNTFQMEDLPKNIPYERTPAVIRIEPTGEFRLFMPNYIHVCSDPSNGYYGMTSIIVINNSLEKLVVQVFDINGNLIRALKLECDSFTASRHQLFDAQDNIVCNPEQTTVFGISLVCATELTINGHCIYNDLPTWEPFPETVPNRVNLRHRKVAIDGKLGEFSYQIPNKTQGCVGGVKRRITSHGAST